jgi:hypothetical protein
LTKSLSVLFIFSKNQQLFHWLLIF